MPPTPLDKIREEIASRQDPSALRLLCGELSPNEVLTVQALMKWMLHVCEKHLDGDSAVTHTGLEMDQVYRAINRARQSHPDSISATALHSAEREIEKLSRNEAQGVS